MAKFCSKCGTELKEGVSFCSGCGSRVDADPQLQQQPMQQPMYQQPGYQQQFAPPGYQQPMYQAPPMQQAYQQPMYQAPPVQQAYQQPRGYYSPMKNILQQLSEKIKIEGIIWLVVAIMQYLGGLGSIVLGLDAYDGGPFIFYGIFVLLVGVCNTVFCVKSFKYSNEVLAYPVGIVSKYEPIGGVYRNARL